MNTTLECSTFRNSENRNHIEGADGPDVRLSSIQCYHDMRAVTAVLAYHTSLDVSRDHLAPFVTRSKYLEQDTSGFEDGDLHMENEGTRSDVKPKA